MNQSDVRAAAIRPVVKGRISLTLFIQIVQLISAVMLVGIVLFQSGKSAGLSGAIGGGSETYFARNKGKTLEAKLARATKWVAIVFVLLTLVLNLI
jgi:preprotein translocase subunit SecG